MKTLLLSLILALAPFCLHAQFSFAGHVFDASNNTSLSGAHVMLQNTFLTTVTSRNGNFTFNNLPKGDYSLKITFMGYTPEIREVTLENNLSLDIQLQPGSILQDEVVIQSTRVGEKIPVTFQNISGYEIESENMGQDLPMLLSNSISAVATSDAGNGMGYTALRIRGTDMTRINVTINGIPLNDPESHNVFWVDLPDFAASTDNIQIQRGVGTSTNGAAAFGASINLQSAKMNPDAYGEICSSFGSFTTSKNSLSFGSGLINNHWTLDARVSKLNSSGYIDRAASDLFSYYLSGAYSDKKNVIRFNIFSGKEITYQAWDGIPHDILDTNRTYNGMGLYFDNKGKQHFYNNETDNYNQTHFQVLYSRQLSHSLYLNTAAHYTKGLGYYEEYRESDKLADYGISPIQLQAPFYLIGRDTIAAPDSLISSSDLIRRKWLNNDFAGITWSFSWNEDRFKASVGGSMNTYIGRHYGQVVWSQFAGNSEIDHEWYRSKATKNDFNLYAKVSYDLSNRINAYADIQMRKIKYGIAGVDDDTRDITQDHSYTFFNPKAGLYFTINTTNSVYASVAIANREPNRDNFVDANLLKPAPKPETLYDVETGYSLQKEGFAIHTNLYYMYYHDQLALTGAINDVGAAVMENVAVSYRTGMEFLSQFRISRHIRWNLSATFSRNKIKAYTEYVDDWNNGGQIAFEHHSIDLAFAPSILANSDILWNVVKNGSIQYSTKYISKQYIDNTQSADRSLHSYLLNNIKLNYSLHPKFMKSIVFTLAINNLLNEKYESNAWVYRYYEGEQFQVMDGYFPQAGINFMAGLVLKL